MDKPTSAPIFNEQDFPVSLVRLSILRGTGVDIDELKDKPIIGIVNSHTEMNPGHMHLRALADRVKEGVHAAGGIPFEFGVPAPCDGLTEGNEGMRFVLPQRELIADIVETHARSMLFDGLVMIASCDKIIPGMIMAAARLDRPTIFLTGGPGAWQIRFSSRMEGSVDHKDYDDIFAKLECATCATCGSCEIMGTANTFQCMAEALGLTLPGSSSVPAFHSEKLLYARRTGKRIVDMVGEGLSARKVLTPAAIENAAIVDLAIGGSTNSTLHLPAIAHELGLELPLERFNELGRKVPTLLSISPNGPHGMIDLYRAGGVPAVMKVLADDLDLSVLNVTGGTLADVVAAAQVLDEEVIPPRDKPFQPEGGTVALFGNLAPEGSVVKQAAVSEEMRVFTGPARVFESEAECLEAIREKGLNEGEVLIIRNEGPRGGPGMPEALAVTMALELHGYSRVALVTDGRFSGASAGPCVGHASPEACVGGPIAALRDGDKVTIDIPGRSIEVDLTPEEIARRLKDFSPVERDIPEGYMRRYVKYVGSAARGAVLE
ncbi:MAG TPA: dihydroxy-acid dehydratase [Candidatus Anoxymicrobiaceae bacterium]